MDPIREWFDGREHDSEVFGVGGFFGLVLDSLHLKTACFFSNLAVSSTESAVAIVVEPFIGLKYPFSYDPSVLAF